jgi:hypothetical protein
MLGKGGLMSASLFAQKTTKLLRSSEMTRSASKRLMHRSKRQALFDHELLRRCDDFKSSIAPILNGPKNFRPAWAMCWIEEE